MKKKALGEKGEALASDFLQKNGYQLRTKNYRYKQYQIDIIAQKENRLIFVEVKTRSSTDFGFPETQVSAAQEKAIQTASEQYILEQNWEGDIRFDIIAIDYQGDSSQITHFIDAFY